MRDYRPDQRIVHGYSNPAFGGYCRHYGKAISVEEWEAACDDYERWFPEPYRSNWRSRKGNAVHAESDFGRPLYTWDEVKSRGVCIGQLP